MLNLMGMKTKGNYHSRLDPGIRKDIMVQWIKSE